MSSDRNPLRLGSIAPNFDAETTQGPIKFHDFIGNSWAILFSHPADFTPVCTTELGVVARLQPKFDERNVKVIGLSANGLESHEEWIKDINEVNDVEVKFPIIADADRKISTLYDMLDYQDLTNLDAKGIPFTVRSVFIIDPKKTIRLTLSYPASTGRNFDEILRVVDSLQLGDKNRITTPANWKHGDNVIVHPSVSNEEAATLFPGFKTVKPYLRFATQPGTQPATV
ncbi:MAG: thioredoxin-like protein [Linnemannia elongata]|nr:MAG: thioredoxin-like protein [Linnemannia elongata]